MQMQQNLDCASEKSMDLSGCITSRATRLLAVSLLALAVTYACLWPPEGSLLFFQFHSLPNDATQVLQKDELETSLERASMANKTVIIGVINKAYVEDNGMLDLFLRSLREGESTEFLIQHLLLVAADQTAFERCMQLRVLHCYRLVTEGVDLSEEVLYMSEQFIRMMWRITLFLGEVLRRGYSFIFTDMDVLWMRNPFAKLSQEGGDMQISCDSYYGDPMNDTNHINTGFYFVSSNNRTIALFDAWYEARNNSAGLKEQDVLIQMKDNGVLKQLGVRVRYLDTLFFSGFCQQSRDFREVRTVHANCCVSVKAKLEDLRETLQVWKEFNGTATARWPKHKACEKAWEEHTKVENP